MQYVLHLALCNHCMYILFSVAMTSICRYLSHDMHTQLKIRPGQTIRVNLIGSDQFNNPTQLIARLSDSRSGINLGAFRQAAGGGIELNNSNVSTHTHTHYFD